MRKLYVSICESENELLSNGVSLAGSDGKVEEVLPLMPLALGERITTARLVKEAVEVLNQWLKDHSEADYDEPERP